MDDDSLVDMSAAPGVNIEMVQFEPALIAIASVEALKRDRRLAALAGPAPSDLTRLSAAHRAVIALHLSGSPAAEISSRLQRPIHWVIQTLRDPLARRVIDSILAVSDMEIAALMPLANAAVRQSILHGNMQQKLRAADIVYKANHKYVDTEGTEKSTAEDVIQQILSFAGKALETVAAGAPAYMRDVSPSPALIEGDPNVDS